MTRFERATPSSQARCATKLRHIPMLSFSFLVMQFGRISSIRLAEASLPDSPPSIHNDT